MRLLIVGTGYVGLVTGTCFAEMGHQVVCLDIDQSKIANLSKGIVPFYEPGLDEMVKRNVAAQRLRFTSDYAEGVAHGELLFIAVSTPQAPNGQADLSAVRAVAHSLATHMQESCTIVLKSTVPVGTHRQVKALIADTLKQRRVDFTFDLLSNPEFLAEGDAIHNCMKPDRVIIGAENSEAAAKLCDIYASFTLNHDRILIMDPASAELTKYAANAMLATRISFMNELAGFCEHTGADIRKVRQGMGADHRIGYDFLYAGAGFGGSCFPKDLQALQAQAIEAGSPLNLIPAVIEVNTQQKQRLGQKILHYFSTRGGVADKTVAVLGLSFKPKTDDMREAPSCILIQQLLEAGAELRLYDPVAMENAKRVLPKSHKISWCESELEAGKGAHAIVLVTEWHQFRFLDMRAMRAQMVGGALFDGRNQYQGEDMVHLGFDYISIGQAPRYVAGPSPSFASLLENAVDLVIAP